MDIVGYISSVALWAGNVSFLFYPSAVDRLLCGEIHDNNCDLLHSHSHAANVLLSLFLNKELFFKSTLKHTSKQIRKL